MPSANLHGVNDRLPFERTECPGFQRRDRYVIPQINAFSENGVSIPVPGLGTSFGLYIEGSVTVQGSPSAYGPGTISLVLDPTNNDGTPAAVWDTTTHGGSWSSRLPDDQQCTSAPDTSRFRRA